MLQPGHGLEFDTCRSSKCFSGNTTMACPATTSGKTVECELKRSYTSTARLTVSFEDDYIYLDVENPYYDCGRMYGTKWTCSGTEDTSSVWAIATGACNAATQQSFVPLRVVLGAACHL